MRFRFCRPTHERQDRACDFTSDVTRPRARVGEQIDRTASAHSSLAVLSESPAATVSNHAADGSRTCGKDLGLPAIAASASTPLRACAAACLHSGGITTRTGAPGRLFQMAASYRTPDVTHPIRNLLIVFIHVFIPAHLRAADGWPVMCASSRRPATNEAKNQRDETILREPRNHPETDGA